jgi:cytochrome c biogenesis protein CcmG/thiol:disulfide interchange protein DsbE
MMKRKILIYLYISVFLIIGFTCLAVEPPNLIGRQMPRLTVKDWLSKQQLEPRDLADRVYVVEFWAAWCSPCIISMPHTNQLAKKYRQNEVLFISISRDPGPKQPKTFIDKNDLDNLFVAMDNGMGEKLGVVWIPMAYIVGTDGKILWQGIPSSESFEYAIEKVVKESPPAFLSGIDLGPYEDLRFQLSGCSGFPRAYRKLRMDARNDKSPNAAVAAKIIETMDAKITSRIEQIRKIQADEPEKAILLYQKLISRFKGAEPIEQAKAEYEKFINNLNDEKKREQK